MRKYYLAAICLSLSLLAFSQSPKPATPGKPATAAARPKAPLPAGKGKSVVKAPPAPVLTPAELRRKNTDDLLSFMLDCGDLMNGDYDVYSDRKQYLEYTAVTDTSATVLLKNALHHTVNRIVVNYDSTKVKHMVQYKSKKKNNEPFDNNAKWVTVVDNSYFFVYDSINPNRVAVIGKARYGREDLSFQISKYFFVYRNNAIDSIEHKNDELFKWDCTYYNGKKKPDSIYRYSYTMGGTPRVVFLLDIDTYQYEGTGTAQREKRLQDKHDYPGFDRYTVSVSEKGTIAKTRIVTKNYGYGTKEALLDVYAYDTTGRLVSIKAYKSGLIVDKEDNATADSVLLTTTPHESTYVYNEQGLVIRRIISYHDKCEDSEETTEFTIGEYGFVTETKSKKDAKFKCRY